MKSTLATTLLVMASVTVGCKKAPSTFDNVNNAPANAKGNNPGVSPTPGAEKQLPKDMEGRMARVEKRLDKVIETLEQALPPSEPNPATAYSVPINNVDPVEGPADAKVTIVEAFEFLCPYCALVAPTVDQVIAKYPKDVRVVSKYMLIHGAKALPPAMAACAAAKQGKYGAMKTALWTSLFKIDNPGTPQARPNMQQGKETPEAIKALAAGMGLDMAKYDADIAGADCQSWVKSSQEVMRPVGATGTPAFFVNGRFLNGAVPFDAIDAMVKEELAKADKAIADGTAQKDYYNGIVAKGEKRVAGRFED
jgi:protein-disulfide isomerase